MESNLMWSVFHIRQERASVVLSLCLPSLHPEGLVPSNFARRFAPAEQLRQVAPALVAVTSPLELESTTRKWAMQPQPIRSFASVALSDCAERR